MWLTLKEEFHPQEDPNTQLSSMVQYDATCFNTWCDCSTGASLGVLQLIYRAKRKPALKFVQGGHIPYGGPIHPGTLAVTQLLLLSHLVLLRYTVSG